MKFERIRLYGFKDKDRIVEVKFSDEPVSIIYGENGCGKTSLLKVIHAILSKDEQLLITENIQKIELEVSQYGKINEITIERNTKFDNNEFKKKKINNYDYQREIPYNSGERIEKFIWSNYEESGITEAYSILFGVNRAITNTSNILPEQIENFFMTTGRNYRTVQGRELFSLSEELAGYLNRNKYKTMVPYDTRRKNSKLISKNSVLDKLDMGTIENLIFDRYSLANQKKIERVQNALFETLSYAIYSGESEGNKIHDIPEDFETLLIDNKDKLLEALRDTRSNKLQNNIIDILERDNIPEIIQECQKNNLLLNLLVKMIKELKADEAILESINTLEMIFNNNISKEKKLVVDKNGVSIKFNNNKNNHGLNELSSGEKHLLTLLTIFLIEGKDRDILMIDEPELSLNIKWQRRILDLLTMVAPNAQIIVASHSPVIGRKNTNYLVKLV